MHRQHLYTFAWKIFCIRKSVVCRTRCKPSSPAAATICTARPVWYRVQTGAACPACRCASCCVRSALHLARPALLPVLCIPSGCTGGGGLHRRGIQGTPGVGQVMPAHSEANKKGVFPTYPPPLSCAKHPHPHCQSQKFRPKNKKTPTKGLCSVLYLPYKP